MTARTEEASPYAKWWMASYVVVAVASFVRGVLWVLSPPVASVSDMPSPFTTLGGLLVEMPFLLPINLLLGPIGLAVVVGVQKLNPFSAPSWHRPTWRRCPFTSREPLQFFHLVAWALLAGGIGALGASVTADLAHRLFAAYLVLSGVGLLLGVGVSTRLYVA